MLDPRQTFIDVTVTVGRDVTIYPGTMLQGATAIGDGCEIGPDTQLDDARSARAARSATPSASTPRSAPAPGRSVRPPASRISVAYGASPARSTLRPVA